MNGREKIWAWIEAERGGCRPACLAAPDLRGDRRRVGMGPNNHRAVVRRGLPDPR
jgi:hypothetical protein